MDPRRIEQMQDMLLRTAEQAMDGAFVRREDIQSAHQLIDSAERLGRILRQQSDYSEPLKDQLQRAERRLVEADERETMLRVEIDRLRAELDQVRTPPPGTAPGTEEGSTTA